MVIVLGIIGFVSAVVFSSQANFNNSVILSDTVYDVALTIRATETYGIGNQVGRGANPTRPIGYGVHFSYPGASTNQFLTFADTSPTTPGACHPTQSGPGTSAPNSQVGDCVYTANSDIQLQTYTVGNGITLTGMCAQSNGWSCTSQGAGNALTSLDISSVRPNTVITMSANGSYSAAAPVILACLRFASAQGTTRYIKVTNTGLILPQATTCAPAGLL